MALFSPFCRDSSDKTSEAKAASGLGLVHQKMSDWQKALNYHTLDLELSEETQDKNGQARALANLSAAYEGMTDLEKAMIYSERHLKVANSINDSGSKTQALGSLGELKIFTIGNAN